MPEKILSSLGLAMHQVRIGRESVLEVLNNSKNGGTSNNYRIALKNGTVWFCIEDLTRVVISDEIYETSLQRVS